MSLCKSPGNLIRKKALGLLEQIEGPSRGLQLRDFSGDLRLKRNIQNKSVEFASGYCVKELSTPRLPGLGCKKLNESFKSQNDGTFVFKNKAGVLVVPKMQVEKSTEYKDIFQTILEDKILKEKVKSLKNRFKQISLNITPNISRKLKQKIKLPSVAERGHSPQYLNTHLSPVQISLIHKWNEKLGLYK